MNYVSDFKNKLRVPPHSHVNCEGGNSITRFNDNSNLLTNSNDLINNNDLTKIIKFNRK